MPSHASLKSTTVAGCVAPATEVELPQVAPHVVDVSAMAHIDWFDVAPAMVFAVVGASMARFIGGSSWRAVLLGATYVVAAGFIAAALRRRAAAPARAAAEELARSTR